MTALEMLRDHDSLRVEIANHGWSAVYARLNEIARKIESEAAERPDYKGKLEAFCEDWKDYTLVPLQLVERILHGESAQPEAKFRSCSDCGHKEHEDKCYLCECEMRVEPLQSEEPERIKNLVPISALEDETLWLTAAMDGKAGLDLTLPGLILLRLRERGYGEEPK